MYDDIARILDVLIGQSAPAVAEEMLRRVRDDWSVQVVLETLVHKYGDNSLNLPASYEHDNGYAKVVLMHSPATGAKLRLNYWHRALSRECNIHDHKWAYASLTLLGVITESIYVPEETGQFYHHYRYHSRRSADIYRMEHLGSMRLRCSDTRKYYPGAIYSRLPDLLHRIHADAVPSATLQLTFNDNGLAKSGVYSNSRLFGNEARVRSPPLTHNEVNMMILRVIDQVANA